MWHRRILGVVIGGLALLMLFVTVPKLLLMAQVKGVLPGRTISKAPILEKWHQENPGNAVSPHIYWIRWDAGDITKRGQHRLNLQRDQWEKAGVGDSLSIVQVRGNVFILDTVYVSGGNFFFDFILLAVELLVLRAAVRLWRRPPASVDTSTAASAA